MTITKSSNANAIHFSKFLANIDCYKATTDSKGFVDFDFNLSEQTIRQVEELPSQAPLTAEMNTAGELMDFSWETDTYENKSSELPSTEQNSSQLFTPSTTHLSTAQTKVPIIQQAGKQQNTRVPDYAITSRRSSRRQHASTTPEVSNRYQRHSQKLVLNPQHFGSVQPSKTQQSTHQLTPQGLAATTQQSSTSQLTLARVAQQPKPLQTIQTNDTQKHRAQRPGIFNNTLQPTPRQQITGGSRKQQRWQEVPQQRFVSPIQRTANARAAEDEGISELEKWCREQDTVASQQSHQWETQRPVVAVTDLTSTPSSSPQTSDNLKQGLVIPQHDISPPLVNSPQAFPQQLPLPLPTAPDTSPTHKSLAEMVARPRHLQLTLPKPAPGKPIKRTFEKKPRVPYIRITSVMTEEQKLEAAQKNQEMAELDRAEKRMANNAAAKRSRDNRKAKLASQAVEIHRLTVRGRAQDEGFTRMAQRQQEMSKRLEAVTAQLAKTKQELDELKRRHRGSGCEKGPDRPHEDNSGGAGGGRPQGGNGGGSGHGPTGGGGSRIEG